MKTRSQKAVLNTTFALVLELVTAISGLVLPRLILSYFGSEYNGITNSISQFIGCIAILKSGIGSVTRAALYKSLADNDTQKVSMVVKATQSFLRRIAIIFLGFIIVFAFIYPFLVSDSFDWFFSFSMVLILSISTFAQYFFGLTYQMVLESDQKNYVVSIVSMISIVINVLLASAFIVLGFEIRVVKLISALVFAIPPIFYSIYVSKKYNINKKLPAPKNLLNQRWDAFAHQIANFVNDNTPVILLTVFTSISNVSIYSIYNMITFMIKKVLMSITNGINAAFGNMLAKKEKDLLVRRFRQYEMLIFLSSTILLAVTSILFVPFIKLYTVGITDANYINPTLAILLSIATFFICVKMPYQDMVYAAGRFKETRNATIFEAVINLVVSIVAVNLLGMPWVALGTIVGALYRTINYSIFVSKNVLEGQKNIFPFRMLYSIVVWGGTYMLFTMLPIINVNTWGEWILSGVLVFVLCTIFAMVIATIMFKNDMVGLLSVMKSLIKRKRKNI